MVLITADVSDKVYNYLMERAIESKCYTEKSRIGFFGGFIEVCVEGHCGI